MPNYPLLKYRFRVTGIAASAVGFTQVTGLEVSTEVVEYREGDMEEQFSVIQPGMQTYGEVTFHKGVFVDDFEMWDWWNLTNNGGSVFAEADNIARRDVTIELLSNNSEPMYKWIIRRAWPTKIAFDDLNSESNETSIQTLTVRHEGLRAERP